MDNQERVELVRRLFSLMTAKLEDAASEAVDGQGADRSNLEQAHRADHIELLARDVGLLAQSVAAIASSGRSQ